MCFSTVSLHCGWHRFLLVLNDGDIACVDVVIGGTWVAEERCGFLLNMGREPVNGGNDLMSSSKFSSVFIAVILATALIFAALVINQKRPSIDTMQPSASFVKATGKCAECHRRETASVVHQYERSRHAEEGINCLDCHAPTYGQKSIDHNGFVIATELTSKNCAGCHRTEHDQYLRSRHAAPSWAAVRGAEDFTVEQIAFSEKYHPGAVKRSANALSLLEGEAAITKGCSTCHNVGAPNADGSIGKCTHCHSRHSTSVALAREPETCGQCHMGPDHSQLEIYHESKHGVLYNAQRAAMNLTAHPKELSSDDMSVPTCATCHMSGFEGLKVTHDTTERLSWYLFAATSEKRSGYERGQAEMKEVCLKCHTEKPVERFFAEAEDVLHATNDRVAEAKAIMDGLRADGLLTPEPFDEPIEFEYFDYWHYFGRTAKHGAFMGGADFVQWHGNYELLKMLSELRHMATEIRGRASGHQDADHE